jgi:hypothetical protein
LQSSFAGGVHSSEFLLANTGLTLCSSFPQTHSNPYQNHRAARANRHKERVHHGTNETIILFWFHLTLEESARIFKAQAAGACISHLTGIVGVHDVNTDNFHFVTRHVSLGIHWYFLYCLHYVQTLVSARQIRHRVSS